MAIMPRKPTGDSKRKGPNMVNQKLPHKAALYILAFTEVWERFGFYLMLALFSLYLSDKTGLGMTDDKALEYYGSYMMYLYMVPFLGGLAGDHVIGYKPSVILGGILMAAGYMVMGGGTTKILFIGCVAIVLGNGLFKPSISTLVGKLYKHDDPRKDNAFSLFYMAVNIGALFAGPVAEEMKSRYGWKAAFQTAGAGMILGVVIFTCLMHLIKTEAEDSTLRTTLVPQEVQKRRHYAIVEASVVVMFFWMAFHQNGGPWTFWIRDCTDRTFGGLFSKPSGVPTFNIANSTFVILFTPPLVWFFRFLDRKGLEPSVPTKISIGMFLTSLAFVVMGLGGLAGGDHKGVLVSVGYFIVANVFITLGELCVSPMGLTMVNKLAAAKWAAAFMGVWFLATGLGNKMVGLLGAYWKVWLHSHFFFLVATICAAAGLWMLARSKKISEVMPNRIQNSAMDSMLPPDIAKMPVIGIIQPS